MAARYVEEIRECQPEGPYHLIGYSLGSLIAFEIAQQLHQSSQRVALLGLLDPPARPAPWLVYARTLSPYFRHRAVFHLRQWSRESLHLKRRWRRLGRWIAKNRRRAPVVIVSPENAITPAPDLSGCRARIAKCSSASAGPFWRRYWSPPSIAQKGKTDERSAFTYRHAQGRVCPNLG